MNTINFYEVLKYLNKNTLSSGKKLKIKTLSNFNTFQLEIFLQYFMKKKGISLNIHKSEFNNKPHPP